MTRRQLIGLLAAAQCALADDEKAILGTGWGLDHIEIAVSSDEAARETYFGNLGFTVSAAANAAPGVQHSAIFFGPPYVEFIWLGGAGEPDLKSPPGLQLRRSLNQGGGIFQYNIDVSEVETVRDRLAGSGMKVQLQPSTRMRDGKEEPAPWRFLTVTDDRNGAAPPRGVPGGDAVGIIEYRNNSSADRLERMRKNLLADLTKDPRRASNEDHANTARSLHSVLVAVPDVASAVKECASFGLAAAGNTRSTALGAVGQQVACGQGFIEFWQPASRKGPLSSMLSQKGPGPFGFSVKVANLERAHHIMEEGLKTKLAIESYSSKKGFTVSGGLTGGVWVGFLQT